MSLDRARKALRGEPTDRIPIFDVPSHYGFVKHVTGMDPKVDCRKAVVAAMRKFDFDMALGWVPPSLQTAEEYAATPHDGWRNSESTQSAIFDYDPFMRTDVCGMDWEGSVRQCQKEYDDDMSNYGDFCLPVGRTFTTLIHYAAEDLNWESFMMAALTEEDRVDGMIEHWMACSTKNISAWMQTGIQVMVTHDDIAMSKGMIMSPDWLRRHIFPRYRTLFDIIKKAGRIHLFMTDGNFSEVAPDLAALDPDGYFIDPPCVDLEWLAGVCGKDKIYYTGPAPALFQNGTRQEIRDEVRRLADIARRDLPRFFFHSLGAIMSPSIPTGNVVAYYEACLEFGQR